ncbi:Aldehyde dehydrogenase family 2 member C4 [Zea mays]|uniref:Aldehyde dehydrogenase family 2 member C4 n=1 Tax=Zea mays TaxID=4577 RepID=A0A1D6FYF5_MAIZE|nr:Aldehyde dehydrogenase family 2 member C4 [Zea mays]
MASNGDGTAIDMASNGNGDGTARVVVPEIKFTKLFINGEFVDAASGKTFETRDPRTGDVLAHVAEADQADVDLAVKSARDAFDHGKWPRMSGYERGRVMSKLADLVEQHTEELAALDGADAGKLLLLGKMIDIPAATQMLRYYAGAADKIHGDVAFTGSTEVGRLIMESAARSNLKTVWLELGGKSPLIIFDDADVDMAVNLSRLAVFFNKEGIYDEFAKKTAEAAQNWKVGDPFDVTSNMGPQVDKDQFERVLKYIELGKSEGATLLTGGKPAADKGYYIEPTIFVDVTEDMRIAQEEIFGPVMSLMKFRYDG